MASIVGAREQAAAPASHPYTCNTCQVAFRNSDLQKGHMRGDWHRYNLKRRVASLPPISSEVFAEKVLQARATTSTEAEKVGFERACDVCQRTYYSENSFRNHISSQKHKAKEAAAAQNGSSVIGDEASSVVSSTFSLGDHARPTGITEVDTDAEEEFSQVVQGMKNTKLSEDTRPSPVKRPSNPHLSAAGQRKSEHPLSPTSPNGEESSPSTTPTPSKSSAPESNTKTCLFCNYNSPTLALNAAHMERFHGMFIPEKQYLVNMEGLIGFLEERIRDHCECVYCGKVKSDVYAVQTHMRDTSHCKIPYTTIDEQLEIGDFYDFRSTYSDGEEDSDDDDSSTEDDKPNGGAKLGARRSAKQMGKDGDEVMEDDEGWETDSSASSLDSADLTAVPADQHYHQYERLGKHPHHSQTDPRSHHQKDGWHSHAHKHNHAVFYDEYELHLPSGKSVGHRSLNRYFRQNLHNYPSPEERAEQERLALENGDEMDVDGNGNGNGNQENALAHRERGRALHSRRAAGMMNVPDKVKQDLVKSQHKATRMAEAANQRRATKFSSKSIGSSFRWGGAAPGGAVGGR